MKNLNRGMSKEAMRRNASVANLEILILKDEDMKFFTKQLNKKAKNALKGKQRDQRRRRA